MNIKQLLPHLHYFWAVVNNRKLSGAAVDLHVSHSAVSYQIKSLEEKIGEKLLTRNNSQGVGLTEIGERVADECSKIFSYVDKSLNSLIESEKERDFHITAPITFGSFLLMPSLMDVNKKFNEADFKLYLTDDLIDIVDNKIDVAIRNIPPEKYWDGQELLKINYVPVATEEYLSSSEKLETPSDFNEHKLICVSENNNEWLKVKVCVEDLVLPDSENFSYMNNYFSVMEGVKSNQGIALLPDYMIDGSDDKLVLVLEDRFSYKLDELSMMMYICYPKLSVRKKQIEDFVFSFIDYIGQYNNDESLN